LRRAWPSTPTSAGIPSAGSSARSPRSRLSRSSRARLRSRGARCRARARSRAGALGETVGPFAAGTRYHGRDPDLVLWVWATLVDTALAVYRDFVAPLDADALAEYHRDQRALALLLGAPADRTPGDPESFRCWFDGVLAGDTLTVGATAREIARAVLDTPGVDRGPVPLITVGAVARPAAPRVRARLGRRARAPLPRALIASVRALRPVGARAQASRSEP
jgi:uncharacterized protein (DUF2236 family)